MKNIGCNDLILDNLIDTAKMAKYPDKKFKFKKKIYDESGKYVKTEKSFYII